MEFAANLFRVCSFLYFLYNANEKISSCSKQVWCLEYRVNFVSKIKPNKSECDVNEVDELSTRFWKNVSLMHD